MKSEHKLTKAKAKLMLEHPYFGSIASALKFTPIEFAIMLVKDMQKNAIPVENAPHWEEWVRKFSYLLA